MSSNILWTKILVHAVAQIREDNFIVYSASRSSHSKTRLIDVTDYTYKQRINKRRERLCKFLSWPHAARLSRKWCARSLNDYIFERPLRRGSASTGLHVKVYQRLFRADEPSQYTALAATSVIV